MKLCLDTNAYSRLMRGHAPLRDLLETAEQVLIPATVLGELHAGFAQGSRAKTNQQQLRDFLSEPGVEILPIDADIAERYGLLVAHLSRQGTPLPTNDIWIAATALEAGARLITADAHFASVPGLIVVNP